ncbi:MAG TPA: type II secretion system protein N [Xanthomonadaceae bacterium]|nr:type II secretion system protein N [Xanthomonadaceae bacterium]
MRAGRALGWAVLLLVLVSVALAWSMPAGFGLRLLGQRLGPLDFAGVSGTLWEGRAAQARFFGVAIGPVSWRIERWPLVRGITRIDLALEGEPVSGGGRLETRGDLTRVDAARLHFPARLLEPALDIPALDLRGEVVVEIDQAELLQGLPRSAHGRAIWREAAVAGAAAAALGDLVADFRSTGPGEVAGTLADRGGPLQLDGSFHASPLGFVAEARLSARGGNPQVREALNFVGQPMADGSVLYRVEGGFLGTRQ